MQQYTIAEHLTELKKRLAFIGIFFVLASIICYYFSNGIYNFILEPLAQSSNYDQRKVIYTGLGEAFFTYLKLSFWSAFLLIIPVICYQIYGFISPGLIDREKKIIAPLLVLAPLLFYLGGFFVFYLVMPQAWSFFLSFENSDNLLPIMLEARVSEYLSIVMQLVTAFGLAFELPIIMLLLSILGLISGQTLKNRRRLAVVIIFLSAAIFTPPDVFSQIALAIPLILLYEISIIICNFVEKRGGDRKC